MTLTRCPNAMVKHPWAQHCIRLFAAYKRGLTPNGCLNQETAHYAQVMHLMEVYEAQASAWYTRESKRQG